MKLPDLLATRRGRFSAFFFLYVTEGLPLGFTATAVATQMRRQGLGPSEIGVFVGTLYLPWAWKWVMGLGAAWAEIRGYCIAAVKAFVGSRAALVGAVVAILPAGAYSLSLALQSNLAVELGLSDRKIALLALLSTVISAVGCVAGGYLSDRFGRKRMLAIYLVGTTIPVAALGWVMDRHGWIMPIDPRLPDRPVPADVIIVAFWVGKLGKNCRFCLFFGVPAGVCDGRPPESQLGTLTNGRQEIRM